MSGHVRRSVILGTGSELPSKVVTNRDLEKMVDTSDEWITVRTGIKERRVLEEGKGNADMAYQAAKRALKDAGMDAKDLDAIIMGTVSADYPFPSSACVLEDMLGARHAFSFDVGAACAGFLNALSVADLYVRSGKVNNALVVGSDALSRMLNWHDRGTCILFGDGAGAVVLGREPDPRRGILSTHLHSEGKYAEKLMVEPPSSRVMPRVSPDMLTGPGSRLWPRMEGRYVFKHAVTRFTEVINEALEANGLTAADIDLLIPHQANLRISQLVAMGFELPEEKVFNNIQRYGNTTAASIPIALYEARKEGRVPAGSLTCLASFGAGFTWGAALVRW